MQQQESAVHVVKTTAKKAPGVKPTEKITVVKTIVKQAAVVEKTLSTVEKRVKKTPSIATVDEPIGVAFQSTEGLSARKVAAAADDDSLWDDGTSVPVRPIIQLSRAPPARKVAVASQLGLSPQINIAIAPLAEVHVESTNTTVRRIGDSAIGSVRFEVTVSVVLEQGLGQQL
jgi:hypothetical protein